ncbi:MULTISPECIES: hypothetical protein [unclassified Streptomyces]|uniref:hypothetical protein n=1 Tax=unclassified Streptomyces TaxID=2593676 RepID=UPI00036E094D|nr:MULTISPECIES: hypothetical protein [unclassified Streptomyces]EYT84641.1 hypothetical protein CF54_00275 [Streptomyces sp. Tu 6176]
MQEARCPAPGAPPPGEERDGGLAPTVAALVVSLTVAAVGVYELSGFGLHSLDHRPHLFSDGFATAGVIVATVAAGAAVGNLAWILTAPRRRATLTVSDHTDDHDGCGARDDEDEGGSGDRSDRSDGVGPGSAGTPHAPCVSAAVHPPGPGE